MQRKAERITVIFPAELADELRDLVPERERSKLIAEATREKLIKLRQKRALARTAGAWADEDHPDLMTPEDVIKWLRELRRSSDQRLIDLAEMQQEDQS